MRLLALGLGFLMLGFMMFSAASGICYWGRLDYQEEDMPSLLHQLQDNISSLPDEAFLGVKQADLERNTLVNKVKAVIHQVEAGAFNGSVNKLRNDIEKIINGRVAEPWRSLLLGLIERIIEILKCLCRPPVDSEPPKIVEVLYFPEKPEYDEEVKVIAYVIDEESGVANVTLSYCAGSSLSCNVSMQGSDGLFRANIPGQPYNMTVSFRIYAWDDAGNLACSPFYSYIVGDFTPPVISYIERAPHQPSYNETALIYVRVFEPVNASGVGRVVLSYNNGSEWINRTMNLQGNVYCAEIPAFPFGTQVEYFVYACDKASNYVVTHIYEYTVGDRFLPAVNINSPKDGEFVSGAVTISLYIYDDNLNYGKVTVNGQVLILFNRSGSYSCTWNTVDEPDGSYAVRVDAYDEANNHGWAECQVTVDNTPPTVEILQPKDGSYVRGLVPIEVSVQDVNVDEVKLYVGGETYVWRGIGEFFLLWNTAQVEDGLCEIRVEAFDKARNNREALIEVLVDNTPPSIYNLTWNPRQPLVGEPVNVSVQILEGESGLEKAVLWFRTELTGWQALNMMYEDGNWTCTIPGQHNETTVIFYVECCDKAGNSASTELQMYTVKAAAVQAFPLGWLLAITLACAAAGSIVVYLYRYRRKTGKGRLALIR
ncbi:hypothetical protein DRO54_07185 [Candidatus Bathyarchaeota archaeon]|nr:MAG: hypothetical protein DRO54_07185 [Candidatus Bathyarchaeota archaeon]